MIECILILMKFRIRYVDFWPGFEPADFLFTKIIEKCLQKEVEVIHDSNTLVDLQFHSVFTFPSRIGKYGLMIGSRLSKEVNLEYSTRLNQRYRSGNEFPCKRKVWYTGENLRAPIGKFDASIGFDFDDSYLSNLYFPYWMTRIDWGIGSKGFEIMPTLEQLMSERKFEVRPRIACLFGSEININREKIILATSSSMQVDKYGSLYSNRVKSKKETSKMYSFQICPENDIFPGYVTEKIQEAWICRNIPIWSGLQTIEYFNPEAMIDATYMTHMELVRAISSMNSEDIEQKQKRPILQILPSLTPLENLIAQVID